eukprot:scaffold22436_cov107-Isochrysis_galbana.AAC.2
MSIVSQWVNQHWASICAPTGPGPGSITSGGTEDAERDARRVKQGPLGTSSRELILPPYCSCTSCPQTEDLSSAMLSGYP